MRFIKRFICLLIALILIASGTTPLQLSTTKAATGTVIILDYEVKAFLDKINQQVPKYYNIKSTDIFPDSVSNQPLAQGLLMEGLQAKVDGVEKELGSILVYNSKTPDMSKRYLGINIKGEQYVNTFFKNDVNEPWTFMSEWNKYNATSVKNRKTTKARGWLEEPWVNGIAQGIVVANDNLEATVPEELDRTFDGKSTDPTLLNKSFIMGIWLNRDNYLGRVDTKKGNFGETLCTDGFLDSWRDMKQDWSKFIHIQQPCTYDTWGVGMMWHRNSSGALRYIAVPLAPYKLVQSQYGIVSSGFTTDDTIATVDYIDNSNYLGGILGPLMDAAINFSVDYERHAAGSNKYDIETTLKYYYQRVEDSKIDGEPTKVDLDGALQIAVDIFKDENVLYAFGEYVEVLNRFRTDTSSTIRAVQEKKREFNVAILQYIIDNSLSNKYLVGYKQAPPTAIINGTSQSLGNGYYSLNTGNTRLDDQLSIDKVFQGKFNDSRLSPILYVPTNIYVSANKFPKDMLKQIVREYMKDLTDEAKKVSINGGAPANSVANILDKWNPGWKTWTDIGNILKVELFDVENNNAGIYGTYDSGNLKVIRVNEDAAGQLLQLILNLSSAYKTNKTFTDSSGKPIQVHDILGDGYISYFGTNESKTDITVRFTAGTDAKGMNAGEINKGSVEAITRIAAAEAGQNSALTLTEDDKNNTLNMRGLVGITLAVYSKSIPLDSMVVYRTPDGQTALLNIGKNIADAVPNYFKSIEVPDTCTLKNADGQEVKVKISKVTLKPAYINMVDFVNIMNQNYDANTPIKVGNGFTKFQVMKLGQNKVYYSLTSADENAYNADPDNNRAAIVYYVEPIAQGPKQVDIVEDGSGNTKSVTFKTPVISGGRVVVTPPSNTAVKNWVVSSQETTPFNNTITWNNVTKLTAKLSGTSANNIVIDPTSGDIVYIRYRENNPPPAAGKLNITQKQLTKAFSLKDIRALDSFTFTTSSTEYSGSGTSDSSYNLIVANKSTLPSGIGQSGVIAPSYNSTNKSSSSLSLTPNLFFSAWRYQDKPTLASYSSKNNNTVVNALKTSLGLASDKKPNTSRTGGYTDSVSFKLEKDSSGDYTTTSNGSRPGPLDKTKTPPQPTTDYYHTVTTYSNSDTADYSASLGVQAYLGNANNAAATSSYKTNNFIAGGTTFNHADGFAIPNTNKIKFYPYVEMAYELPISGGGMVDVLAEHESSILPVDYVDIGWFNSNNAASLTLNSNQWSTYKRAVDAKGKNNVLPGGSIFTIDTKNVQSKLGVSTWQTYIPQDQINNVTDGSSYYTQANAASRDTALNDDIQKSIEALNIVQYVDRDSSKSNAFGGIKLNGAGGQNVYGNTTTNDIKYWLTNNTNLNKATEADIDIISSTKVTTYYKVNADTNGNITISKSTNGTSWQALQTLTKTQTAANITNAEAKELENRTKLVTNFILALDRNQGNDPAYGGAWYNEAWNGICILKTDTIYTVGLQYPNVRSAAIDTKLCPPKNSKGDIFTDYYISQFRLNNKSTVRSSEQAGYMGKLNNVDIALPEMQDMFRSRPFYIPNATVQDLIN